MNHEHHYIIDPDTGEAHCIKDECKHTRTFPKDYTDALEETGKTRSLGAHNTSSLNGYLSYHRIPMLNIDNIDLQEWKNREYLKIPARML